MPDEAAWLNRPTTPAEKDKGNEELKQSVSRLLGFRTENLGPLSGVAEMILDATNIPRYGMTERERSQLIGRLPGSPSYGPAAERYLSAYLFARQNPALAGLVGPANKITDWMYDTELAPHATAGVKAFAESGANPYDPDAPTPQEIAEAEDRRRTQRLLSERLSSGVSGSSH